MTVRSHDTVTIGSPRRIAFLGGFIPRLCGIATFTTDICEAVAGAAPDSVVYSCAVNDQTAGYRYPPRVRFEIDEPDLDSYRRAADLLNFDKADILCVQHEFGIYGGASGSHLLALLREVRMPVVTTLHTVLREPDAVHRAVMDELIDRSARLIVMADKGREILLDVYSANADRIDVIAHGIPDMPFVDSSGYKSELGVDGRTVLFTFGLIGPGKGIEHVIEALPSVVARHPNVVYLVLGATHPHLVAVEGESYRLSLERLAHDKGVGDHVIFFNRFVTLEELKEFIGATDVYLTPYLNEAQITSGTLAYVFGAGKAVVSTPYWHAQELLADGRGSLVPFRDPDAIARAVLAYLDDPELLARTQKNAYRIGRDMIWPAAADQYLKSFNSAIADRTIASKKAFANWTLAVRPYELPPLRVDHIVRMTDQIGIFQHALFNVPNYEEGYCTDDNARAFILCCLLDEAGARAPKVNLEQHASIYLSFVAAALNTETCRFRNFMSFGREWLEKSGSEDSHARALWALGTGAGRSRNQGHRRLSAQRFEKGLPVVESFSSPRAWAFTLLGLHEYLKRNPAGQLMIELRRELVERLLGLWNVCATDDWPWFEKRATYDNARICQALIQSGHSLHDQRLLDIGLKSLRWLDSVQENQKRMFRPIGSDGFYERNGARADFDQQPIEANAMVASCLEAFHATRDQVWLRSARRTFEWFLGRNDLGLALYDPDGGGCSDGLHMDRINENQGAESTLAFHLSRVEMVLFEHRFDVNGQAPE